MMTRMRIELLWMKKSAKLLAFLSVLAIGLLSGKTADASFLIDADVLVKPTAEDPDSGTPGVHFNYQNSALSSNSDFEQYTEEWETLSLLYKHDKDGNVVSGSFQEAFSSNVGDNDFWLEKELGSVALDRSKPLFLVVKDGAIGDPKQYVFDLNKFLNPVVWDVWDGEQKIAGSNFWTGPGAISHIALWGSVAAGGVTPDVVPEPASVALFAFGVACFAVGPLRRRKRNIASVGQIA